MVPALAQYDWDISIEVGDWFLYEGTLISYESNFGFPPPYLEYLQTYNESDWMKYTVIDTSIQGFINFTIVTHWSNGTETSMDYAEDIMNSESLMVIGANLTDHEEIRPEYLLLGFWPMPARSLNESMMLVTTNGTRETNVAIYDWNIFENIYHHTWYWDKKTGIIAYHEEYGDDLATENEGDLYSYHSKLELVNSSLGIILPDLTGSILLLTLIAITIPIYLQKRRRQSKLFLF